MVLLELDEKVSILENQIEGLKIQAREICDSKDTKTTVMPEEYYRLLKERQHLEAELRPLWNEQSRLRREMRKNRISSLGKTFVNSFGEATTREITCETYKRTQKKVERDILLNMGIV